MLTKINFNAIITNRLRKKNLVMWNKDKEK